MQDAQRAKDANQKPESGGALGDERSAQAEQPLTRWGTSKQHRGRVRRGFRLPIRNRTLKQRTGRACRKSSPWNAYSQMVVSAYIGERSAGKSYTQAWGEAMAQASRSWRPLHGRAPRLVVACTSAANRKRAMRQLVAQQDPLREYVDNNSEPVYPLSRESLAAMQTVKARNLAMEWTLSRCDDVKPVDSFGAMHCERLCGDTWHHPDCIRATGEDGIKSEELANIIELLDKVCKRNVGRVLLLANDNEVKTIIISCFHMRTSCFVGSVGYLPAGL